MNVQQALTHITTLLPAVEVVEADQNFFLFAHPDLQLPVDHRMPFITLVTREAQGLAPQLGREDIHLLSIGVSSATYPQLFGKQPALPGPQGGVNTGHDFTQLDQRMPHPIDAPMSWVC